MIWSSHIFFQHNGQWENTELFLDISFTLLWASKLCKLNSKSRIGTQVHAIVEKKNESFYNIKWVLESFVGHAFQSPKDEDILRVSFLSWPMKMATHTLFSCSFGQLKYRNRTQGQVHKQTVFFSWGRKQNAHPLPCSPMSFSLIYCMDLAREPRKI